MFGGRDAWGGRKTVGIDISYTAKLNERINIAKAFYKNRFAETAGMRCGGVDFEINWDGEELKFPLRFCNYVFSPTCSPIHQGRM